MHAAPPGSHSAAGEGLATSDAEGRDAEGRKHAAASARSPADTDGGDTGLAQGGLAWSGDLDALGSLHSPSLAAWLDMVCGVAVQIMCCPVLQHMLRVELWLDTRVEPGSGDVHAGEPPAGTGPLT